MEVIFNEGGNLKIEEAIRSAIEYETRILAVYTQAADEVEDARGKKVLGMLADEEQGHLDYLQHKLIEWQDQGVLTFDAIPSRLPPADLIRAEMDMCPIPRRISIVDSGSDARVPYLWPGC